ncbi:hypothetical protein BCR44DRAFT_1426674 [Catenaria anguillulae PL171]|uniref:Uncharacterized protein n=1 Tax=Catenaria anguillulae PL171 TaxID=765915 RepID=A0A1Y2I0K2_9FUNG|nr:hypothetical protein BCR44DRAFT_1426674 [Catenaria anguillulae PL171]
MTLGDDQATAERSAATSLRRPFPPPIAPFTTSPTTGKPRTRPLASRATLFTASPTIGNPPTKLFASPTTFAAVRVATPPMRPSTSRTTPLAAPRTVLPTVFPRPPRLRLATSSTAWADARTAKARSGSLKANMLREG